MKNVVCGVFLFVGCTSQCTNLQNYFQVESKSSTIDLAIHFRHVSPILAAFLLNFSEFQQNFSGRPFLQSEKTANYCQNCCRMQMLWDPPFSMTPVLLVRVPAGPLPPTEADPHLEGLAEQEEAVGVVLGGEVAETQPRVRPAQAARLRAVRQQPHRPAMRVHESDGGLRGLVALRS